MKDEISVDISIPCKTKTIESLLHIIPDGLLNYSDFQILFNNKIIKKNQKCFNSY